MMNPALTTQYLGYQNPVFARDFPDPFVLKYRGEYWAYCTGHQPDGRVFGILRSRDLVNWQDMGSSMEQLSGSPTFYWAPEVMVDNGRFYLYYSVGDEVNMHIRVAVAGDPAGPFIDQGLRLTQEPFAIDAHVYAAPDGRRYLFYATDFLDHDRVGTGTVIDCLLDPFTTAGRPRPVSRALYDWQIYNPRRTEKGGVRWHTLEGPFVLERKGTYYQMYSGGNWQDPSYGVSYATTQDLNTPDEWRQACDGERVLPILRTIPDEVIGPGHNSVVRGPDNRQLYCVYHRWGKGDGRQLAIDPLDWAGERMLVLGPSHTPQVGPGLPTFADFFDGPRLGDEWRVAGGEWQAVGGAAVATANDAETAVLAYDVGELPFLVEVSAQALSSGDGGYGVSLKRGELALLQLRLSPGRPNAVLIRPEGAEEVLPLPPGFRFDAFHLLRVEVDGHRVSLSVDERSAVRQTLTHAPDGIALFADGMPATFAGFALTVSWQDCFDSAPGRVDPDWTSERPAGWAIRERQLVFDGPGESLLQKGPCLTAYELVVNACLLGEQGSYGIAPALTADGEGPLLTIEPAADGWAARWVEDGAVRVFPLPAGFDANVYQQFRFRKENGRLTIGWEQYEVVSVPVTMAATRIGLYARAMAAFDMARVTAVSSPVGILFLPTQENAWTAQIPFIGPPA